MKKNVRFAILKIQKRMGKETKNRDINAIFVTKAS